jgi:hypothetical protein
LGHEPRIPVLCSSRSQPIPSYHLLQVP